MSKKELVLFSGGPDSTVLLKQFLEEKRNIHVLYINMGWSLELQKRNKLQRKSVINIINYLRLKYGYFDFSESEINVNLPFSLMEHFGKDDQWCVFLASFFCKAFQYKKIWLGHFTFNVANGSIFRKHDPRGSWYENGSLYYYVKIAFRNDPIYKKIKICIPLNVYKGKGIDRFKDKKEAWDYLDKDLKNMVRSCIGDKLFCGECNKCKQDIYYNKRDKEGNII